MSYKGTTEYFETTWDTFQKEVPVDKLNWIVRWEYLGDLVSHVTIYQPRKNILVDYKIKGLSEMGCNIHFGIELGR